METCAVCGKNETGRLMDGGWGKKLPVCGECLRTGRWRELLPAPVEPEPEPEVEVKVEPEPEPEPEATESTPEVVNDLVCPICGRECKSSFGLKSHMRIHK